MSLETLDVIFSNDITFVLYNLFYIGQIDDLDTRARLNRDTGSNIHCGK